MIPSDSWKESGAPNLLGAIPLWLLERRTLFQTD